MTSRNILLLEPGYRNKYPPMGLMKLATYHRQLGDNVVFFKGDLKTFVIEQIGDDLLNKISGIDNSINWYKFKSEINSFLHLGHHKIKFQICNRSKFGPIISNWFDHYRSYYRNGDYKDNPRWDRVCITTLFTFYWKETIDTINFAKYLVKDMNELHVGGILASVLPGELERETGIKPHQGLLNKSGILDANDVIIDELSLDYSLLDEIDYKYPANNSYYSYMTRGCIRKCSFCAVPKLEPEFQCYIPLKSKIDSVNERFGTKQNLLLLDNNVLASERFPEIIEEIKACGFEKGAVYHPPNELEIVIRNLNNGHNEKAQINKSFELFSELLSRTKGKTHQNIFNVLTNNEMLDKNTCSKKGILNSYDELKNDYQKSFSKAPRKRSIDFNQGIDARLIVADERKMELLSSIAINPLRIAFDNMKYASTYIKSVEYASKYGIKNLSNYLLYNEKDDPIELYRRLKINIDLSEELDINIYSFPMKYHPINGERWYNNRNFIGPSWNRKYIRAIQLILNATKGKVGRSKSYFYEAFGKNEETFYNLLYMPEAYILNRFFFKSIGSTNSWFESFSNFSNKNIGLLKSIIESNEFRTAHQRTKDKSILDFIKTHYIDSQDIKSANSPISLQKIEYEKSLNIKIQ